MRRPRNLAHSVSSPLAPITASTWPGGERPDTFHSTRFLFAPTSTHTVSKFRPSSPRQTPFASVLGRSVASMSSVGWQWDRDRPVRGPVAKQRSFLYTSVSIAIVVQ